ncbi:MAG: prepilin-type N-terminal cleavage/methylation domain-containing protein [Bdellovibrionales bacterium]|nr:prepilin-type N-terminal cleavage/methylation domain-containing protein [Bdellovibrionales bacterium]
MLRNNRGFSLIELMVVVAIIAILSMIAVPSYQGFQAKARQKEGLGLLNNYYTAAHATMAEISFFPGNFVATGFAPTGQLTYRVRAQNLGTRVPPFGSDDSGCDSTNDACTCAGNRVNGQACPNFPTWQERTQSAGGSIGPIGGAGCAPAIADATFTTCASAVIRVQGRRDGWSINQLKVLTNTSDGLQAL